MTNFVKSAMALVLVGGIGLTVYAVRRKNFKTEMHRAPDDPAWRFDHGSRFHVKARNLQDGAHYVVLNNGKPLSVTQYFDFVKTLDSKIPPEIPDDHAMPGIETFRVTVNGYLIESHFQREGDKDLHATMSATPDFNSGVLTTELPPGPVYQDARHALWQLVRANVRQWKGDHFDVDEWIFRNPPRIQVSGYVFFDRQHAYGTTPYEDEAEEESEARFEKLAREHRTAPPTNSERTMKRGWEIHPVLSLTPLDKPAPMPDFSSDNNADDASSGSD